LRSSNEYLDLLDDAEVETAEAEAADTDDVSEALEGEVVRPKCDRSGFLVSDEPPHACCDLWVDAGAVDMSRFADMKPSSSGSPSPLVDEDEVVVDALDSAAGRATRPLSGLAACASATSRTVRPTTLGVRDDDDADVSPPSF